VIGWEQKENSLKERWSRRPESSPRNKNFCEEKGKGLILKLFRDISYLGYTD